MISDQSRRDGPRIKGTLRGSVEIEYIWNIESSQYRYFIYLGENQMIFCYFTVQIRNYESKFTIPSCDCVLERLESHLDFGSFSFDMAMTSFGVGHKHHKSYDQKYAALDVTILSVHFTDFS